MLDTRVNVIVTFWIALAIISEAIGDGCVLKVKLPLGILGNGPGNYQATFYSGDIVRFHCINQGEIKYNLTGSPKIQCNKYNNWSAKPPKCKAILCSPSPPMVPNAYLVDSVVSGVTNKIGKTVHYNCTVGYSSPYLTKICEKDGHWQGKINCSRTTCRHPTLSNGMVHFTSLVYGNVATYKCDQGYVLVGPSARTCNRNGQWSGFQPHCYKLCPKLDGLKNGYFSPAQESYRPGQIITFTCVSDKYIVRGSDTRRCLDNGQWSGSSTKCVINRCDPVGDFRHGSIVFDREHYIIGTIAMFKCYSGFKLFGLSRRVCQRNGMWSGERNPSCIALPCREPGIINNGKHDPQNIDGNYRYGTIVKYSCSNRYYLWGNSTIQCTSNNLSPFWTLPAPNCLTLTQFSTKCYDTGGHFHIEHGHPKCVHQAVSPPTSISGSKSHRQLDTLTIVTASAGSTLGALVILLSIMVLIRRFQRNRRFRQQSIRSRFYSNEDHVTLITCPRGFHFSLPSYDEAMSQVQRDPPPFDTIVQDNGTTVINNNINITMPTDESQVVSRESNDSRVQERTVLQVSTDQQINIVNNPMTSSSQGELDTNSTANQVNTRNSISSQESIAISECPSLSVSEDDQSVNESQPLIGSD